MNQSEFLAITCNLLNAREKWRVQGAIGFGFASNSLKNLRETFKPIAKRSNRNHVITFDSHLKLRYLVPNWFNYSDSNDYQLIALIPCYRYNLVPWDSTSKSGKTLVTRIVISSDPMTIFDKLRRKITPPILPPEKHR